MSSSSYSASNYSSCPSSAMSDDEQVSPRQKRTTRVARGKTSGMRNSGQGEGMMGSGGFNKSCYRGVSYDKKKRKWRVQIKVANLGKSGVSVGYFDTEDAAARAYDRAAISLLGRDSANIVTNHPLEEYADEDMPNLVGQARDVVKLALRMERGKRKAPRGRAVGKARTSQYQGVCASNRRNQWQARILIDGKMVHLGYFATEEEAARVFDRVTLALHGEGATTNFEAASYSEEAVASLRGLSREELQRALGVRVYERVAGSAIEGDTDGRYVWLTQRTSVTVHTTNSNSSKVASPQMASPKPASPECSSANTFVASPTTTSLKPVTSTEQPPCKRMRTEVPNKTQPLPLSALLPSHNVLLDTVDNATLLEAALWQDAQASSLLNTTTMTQPVAAPSVQEIMKSDSFRDECTVLPSSVWTPLFGLTTAPQADTHASETENAIAGELLAFPDAPSTALLDGFLHCAAEDALLSSWMGTMLD